MGKRVLEKTCGGYGVRKAVKEFASKVRFLQRVFRSSYILRVITRTRILLPEVWAAETTLLGQAVGLDEDTLRREIAAHLQLCEIDRWRAEAKSIVRHRVA